MAVYAMDFDWHSDRSHDKNVKPFRMDRWRCRRLLWRGGVRPRGVFYAHGLQIPHATRLEQFGRLDGSEDER